MGALPGVDSIRDFRLAERGGNSLGAILTPYRREYLGFTFTVGDDLGSAIGAQTKTTGNRQADDGHRRGQSQLPSPPTAWIAGEFGKKLLH